MVLLQHHPSCLLQMIQDTPLCVLGLHVWQHTAHAPVMALMHILPMLLCISPPQHQGTLCPCPLCDECRSRHCRWIQDTPLCILGLHMQQHTTHAPVTALMHILPTLLCVSLPWNQGTLFQCPLCRVAHRYSTGQ